LHSVINFRQASLLALLLVAAGIGLWNATTIPPLSGYDAGGHAAYIYTIAEEGRLPHPLEGWSTFHPPLYYLIGSSIWKLGDSLSGRHLNVLLRCISLSAILATGLFTYYILRRLGRRHGESWVATALVLFVPSAQMTSVMLGNEALAIALTSAAILPILQLQQDPSRVRLAAVAGLLVGLAMITKYSGIWVFGASLVPFLRRDFDRKHLRALGAWGLTLSIVITPVYLRNTVLCGTPFPMTRTLEPMKSVEAPFEVRPREITDYIWIDPQCILNPSVFYGSVGDNSHKLNATMTNVWGMAYASTWSDAFAHRISRQSLQNGSLPLTLLAILGLVPTTLAMLGFGVTLLHMWKTGRKIPEAPLIGMTLLGIATFVYFTSQAPALVAAKGSYLLPLATPFAVFFLRGLECLTNRWMLVCRAVSIVAIGVAAALFIQELVFPPLPDDKILYGWIDIGRVMPESNIIEAVNHLAK